MVSTVPIRSSAVAHQPGKADEGLRHILPSHTFNGIATDGLDGADPFRLLLGGDDRPPGALDNGHDLGPFGRRNCELVERLRHVIHERVPLARRDTQVPV